MAARTLRSIFLAGCALNPLLSLADGSCSAPPAATSTSVVDVPGYADSEAAPDPAQTARKQAWDNYNMAVVADLKNSSDPRDWAVAASVFMYADNTPAQHQEIDDLFQRAMRASPDDAVVQWLALTGSRHIGDRALGARALDALTKIEPDNGEVWLEAVEQSAVKHDRAGVTAALKRMSSTSRIDTHFADIMNITAQAFDRTPMPDDLVQQVASSGKHLHADDARYVTAANMMSAISLPAYQFVTNACQWDPTGRNADRALDCQAIGRLMMSHGDTLITSSIGGTVLRDSHTFDDSDIAQARELSWIRTSYATTLAKDGAIESMITYQKNWTETGSEIEGMRRTLESRGVSTVPPDGWIDPWPRFSPHQIEQSDANAEARVAKIDY